MTARAVQPSSQEGENAVVLKEKFVESGEVARRQGRTLNHGSVEGQLVELHETEHGDVDIVVVDRAFRARVTARLGTEWAPAAKGAVGGRVIIEGRVLRDADRGLPIRVFDISALEPLPAIDDGALLRAAGSWEAPPGYEIITARAADLDDQPIDPSEDA